MPDALKQTSAMRVVFFKSCFLWFLSVVVTLPIGVEAADLAQQFQSPPDSARPRTWWHWVSGNVSSEGITADLQAMRDIGLGGCQLFTVDQSDIHGPVKFMSPEWRGFVKQSLSEADKLGLEFSIEGCDGWSESGGPWIKPEQGMQHIVWTETNVIGGQKILLDLPQPPATRGFYRDIALLAFPTLKGDDRPLPFELQCNLTNVDTLKLADVIAGDTSEGVDFNIQKDSPLQFDLSYAEPVTYGSLSVIGDSNLGRVDGMLEVSQDGVTFTNAGSLKLNGVSTFPPVTGTYFRLRFPKVSSEKFHLTKISLAAARMNDMQARVGMRTQMNLPFTDEKLSADEVINPAQIINLTGKTKWRVPRGHWTIVRIGHTGTGATTHPSTTPGLECDKLSRAAVLYHLNHMYGPIFADSPDEVGRALQYILLDSWECGCANWTPLMAQDFSQRRGYDLTRWLPVFTGRMVKDNDATQRFLWDFRRTIADLLTENHYGAIQEFAHEHHMGLCSEAPGIGLPTIADDLACKGRTDIPMGEFWPNMSDEDNIDDPREAASAAHIYGKPIAATESFTSTPNVAAWSNDPYSLKRLGDLEFCNGVNRFIFHRYAHQPWNDRVPGMSMGPWGINFERSNTWWKDGSAWIDYLTRCEFLLQQGHFVADLLYFYGEGAAARVWHRDLSPAVPAGYNYDVCNAEILLNQTSVENGDLVLKSGMRYHVLVLPNTDRMTLAMLKKIQSLVRAGATIYGPKPLKSPSLVDDDKAVQMLATQIWGDCDGVQITSHSYGKGRVLWGEPLTNALPSAPDFNASQPQMLFIHRQTDATDIYFVSNQRKSARTVDCTFRVSGKIPELWHPDSGQMETVALYTTTNGCTTVPIQFDPVGSVFVIFREAAPVDHAVSVSLDGEPLPAWSATNSVIQIEKATFGVSGDADKSRDVTAEVQRLVAAQIDDLSVGDFKNGGDPAFGTVKTLTVDYLLDGQPRTASAREGEDLSLTGPTLPAPENTELQRQPDGSIRIQAFRSGDYEVTLASGQKLSALVSNLPPLLTIDGEWQLSFPPKLGAPASATFDHLMSWTDSTNDGVKYFSGTATYEKEIEIPAEYIGGGKKLFLDLGAVKNLAEVSLNGKSLGILWKEPFRVDITDAAIVGTNQLKIRVTNLWPNRLIGDQKLPESQRITWTSVQLYKADSPLLPSGLLGPVQIEAAQDLVLPRQP